MAKDYIELSQRIHEEQPTFAKGADQVSALVQKLQAAGQLPVELTPQSPRTLRGFLLAHLGDNNLKKEEVATKLEISPAYVSFLIGGQRRLTNKLFEGIATLFNLSASEKRRLNQLSKSNQS